MPHSNRRQFLQTSAVLFATAMVGASFREKNKQPLLAFSTLGCPDWTFQKITDFAVQQGYTGIEVRGIQRQVDLVKRNEFSSAANIAATMKIMNEKGLHFVDLGSSATLHFAETAERKKNLEEGRRFIDLAQQLNCPNVRVFPSNFIKEQTKEQTIDLIVKGLLELGEHAKGSNVKVLVESHGDLVYTDDLEKVMQAAQHTNVGMIWDVTNMWTITKENPANVYQRLKKYIHHTHIKDAKLVNGKPQYVLLGKGDVPIFKAIDILSKDGYRGYYSFEWEKLWHPEIAEPEIALADYPTVMKKHFTPIP
jgi:sugar phosphate isomerase/epimerase